MSEGYNFSPQYGGNMMYIFKELLGIEAKDGNMPIKLNSDTL